jgi:putative lipoic acid-binding regulatory protein
MLNTTFDQVMEFPNSCPFKVIGEADDTLADRVVAVAQQLAQDDYVPSVKASSKGSYYSVTIRITVTSKAHIEKAYIDLAAIEGVKRVL